MKKKLGLLVLNYLRYFAKIKIKKINPIIIGVTGSAGKTSCRKGVAQILRVKGSVKESLHSNSESGISLNILNLKPNNYSLFDWLRICLLAPFMSLQNESYDYYVVEMEADECSSPKNMDYLLTIVSPCVGVYVSSGVVHSQGFDSLIKDNNPNRRFEKLESVIVEENGKLLTSLKKTGFAVFNNDSKVLKNFSRKLRARKLSVGTSSDSIIKIEGTKTTSHGFSATYQYQGEINKLELKEILEENYAITYGLALAVGAGLGVPIKEGIKALENGVVVPPGRMRIFNGIKKTTLIDSSYNSSPKTVESALKLLKQVAKNKPKVAILGDMRELGSLSKEAHRKLALQIKKSCDVCYLFGKETGAYTLPRLQTHNFPVYHFDKISELTAHVKANLKDGSFVLIKGSQNTIFLERVVESLLNDKKDVSKLARRGSYWDKIRAKTK